jgi:hypothetical protein
MSSPKAAPGAAASNVASLAALLSPARAEASRRNGARSKGPKTAEGKERSAQNALKHGLRAQKHMVLPGESAAEFATLEAALMEELAPDGALQTILAQRIVAAAWRLQRAECIEAELFARQMKDPFDDCDLGLALIRDGNGAGAFNTLLRYRGGTLAEFSRALRTLKALQAERAAPAAPMPRASGERPFKSEGRTNGQAMAAAPAGGTRMAAQPGADAPIRHAEHIHPRPGARAHIAPEQPNEPEPRRNPDTMAPASGPGGAEARIGEADPRHAGQQHANRWVGRDLRRRCAP